MDSLPKYHETFIPVLKVLEDGKIISYSDMRRRVRDTFYADLPREALELKTEAGDQLILNRIGWAKAYLKQAGMISQPTRGMVQITEKGRQIVQKGSLSLDDVRNDADFLANRQPRASSTSVADAISEETPQDLIESGHKKIQEKVTEELLERLKQMDPYRFESVILELFKKMGYGDVKVTKKSGDGGIDGMINQDKLGLEKIFTQAKRYNDHKVREPEIRDFIGAMSGGTNKGIFVTTSEFDEAAYQKAKESHNNKIILINGYQLVDLMYKYGVGVQIKRTLEIKEVDEDFFEAE